MILENILLSTSLGDMRRGSRGWALRRAPTPGTEFHHSKYTMQLALKHQSVTERPPLGEILHPPLDIGTNVLVWCAVHVQMCRGAPVSNGHTAANGLPLPRHFHTNDPTIMEMMRGNDLLHSAPYGPHLMS